MWCIPFPHCSPHTLTITYLTYLTYTPMHTLSHSHKHLLPPPSSSHPNFLTPLHTLYFPILILLHTTPPHLYCHTLTHLTSTPHIHTSHPSLHPHPQSTHLTSFPHSKRTTPYLPAFQVWASDHPYPQKDVSVGGEGGGGWLWVCRYTGL